MCVRVCVCVCVCVREREFCLKVVECHQLDERHVGGDVGLVARAEAVQVPPASLQRRGAREETRHNGTVELEAHLHRHSKADKVEEGPAGRVEEGGGERGPLVSWRRRRRQKRPAQPIERQQPR